MQLAAWSSTIILLLTALPGQTGWTVSPINGHRYAVTAPMTWTQAEAAAVAVGGHLATVRSATENTWIAANFGSSNECLWIGLNDFAAAGTFVWSSGEPAPYRNWYPGQPDNGNNVNGGESCVHLRVPWSSGLGLTQWNDLPDVASYTFQLGQTYACRGVIELPPQAPQWQVAAPLAAPTSSRATAGAFDSHRARIVRFGGCEIDYPFSGIVGASNDTWEWDGSEWLLQQPAHRPSARFFHSMAYDSVRRRIVMFGGRDANGGNPIDTTWEWDGVDWTNLTPSGSLVPTAREAAALAFDAARGVTVLFGGSFAGGAGSRLADTWTWNGIAWTQASAPLAPTARFGHGMAYDSTNARVLLFGGTDNTNGGSFLNDLWAWNGAAWAQLTPAGAAPFGRHMHSMAFDDTRGELLVFSGDPGNYQALVADTWSFDGTTWRARGSLASPPARRHHALVYDSVRRSMVLFGGVNAPSGTIGATNDNLNDTWTWRDDGAWVAPFGEGCAGSNGVPTLTATQPPVLGSTFAMSIASLPPQICVVSPIFGFSSSNSGFGPLPRDLTFLGMTGCTQWVSVFRNEFLLAFNGQVPWSFAIPNASNLIGVVTYMQAAVWDQGANPLGISMTGALAATLGR